MTINVTGKECGILDMFVLCKYRPASVKDLPPLRRHLFSKYQEVAEDLAPAKEAHCQRIMCIFKYALERADPLWMDSIVIGR